ncbi:MAG TPA: metallopeptidase family protein [candidate division WOR-3 bacterium]|uniref:Metallopeptidase family protein n=1 Tax=candidate division WOR-3 bacterium TaxID=2052148 RepID=A0A9C9EL00_UNCW3|nr:metallopeptidase family protein [candidate division WOR-3 bacterium]
MNREIFEKVVIDVIDSLPRFLREKLENLEIVIEDEYIEKKSLLGLYQGVPLKKRGAWYGNVLPDKIILFKNNIERLSRNEDELKEWIRRVVIHEIGHYFGFGEEELRKAGY